MLVFSPKFHCPIFKGKQISDGAILVISFASIPRLENGPLKAKKHENKSGNGMQDPQMGLKVGINKFWFGSFNDQFSLHVPHFM